MTEDTIARLLRMQERGEEETPPALPVGPMLRAVAGKKAGAEESAAGEVRSAAEEAAAVSALSVPESVAEDGPAAQTTAADDAVLTRRLYESLARAERSVRRVFAAAGNVPAPAASGTDSVEAAFELLRRAAPAVSFHQEGLDARTVDEWFSRDARRYDSTELR